MLPGPGLLDTLLHAFRCCRSNVDPVTATFQHLFSRVLVQKTHQKDQKDKKGQDGQGIGLDHLEFKTQIKSCFFSADLWSAPL